MIKEKYHPEFADDLAFLLHLIGRKRFPECLMQINRAIDQVIHRPHKAAPLKYPPLSGFRKKKFFSVRNPGKQQRPNMRLLYRHDPDTNTFYFLAVGMRIATRPHNPADVYQRVRERDLHMWED
ncbi:hypothetical protein [Staphylospora marina]|uniref:hypothetical protein n=1 Tax=Staphylospora marina TaxID=2490858 RepID=UPI000F5C255F|nr:hypothetical protein [Staphylospora marina]